MRDIRGDLQDRAALLEEQINAHQAQFDKLIDQLKREHDGRLEELKSELDAVNRLMEVELRRLGAVQQQASAQGRAQMHSQPQGHAQSAQSHAQPAQGHAQHQGHQNHPHPQNHQPQQQPQQPLADFLVRKLSEVGALSREDLRRLAVQEGYFPDGESAERGVHATLLNVAKAGLVRQLPNGNFAPATVLDTIRLRRAI